MLKKQKINFNATVRQFDNAADQNNFEIVAIQSGLSKTRDFWPEDVLNQAVELFNSVPVQALDSEVDQHGHEFGSNLVVGGLKNARMQDGSIVAKMAVVDQNHPIISKIRASIAEGVPDLFGFSIVASVFADNKEDSDGQYTYITKIVQIHALDIVLLPAAGGHPIKTTQSTNSIKDKEMHKNFPLENLISQGDFNALKDQVKNLEAQQEASSRAAEAKLKIAQSSLPQGAKDKLISQSDHADFDADAAIIAEAEYIQTVTQSTSPVKGLGATEIVSESEKMGSALDKILTGNTGHGDLRSIRQAYSVLTGDENVTGQRQHMTIAQSTTGDFSEILGNALHRRMLKTYQDQIQFDLWKKLVPNPIILNDFRERTGLTMGGYQSLPTVNEGAAYADLGNPAEQAEKYSPNKRGGTATVTIEMIRNDDVGLIMKIPQKLATSAKSTLNKFVFSLITNNPTLADGNNLFTASRGNLLTNALTAQALASARVTMANQTELGSGEKLGLTPKFVLVPFELSESAFNIFKRGSENDKTFIQEQPIEVIEVSHWIDPTDWYTMADPTLHETIELGFLDGQQEPDLFIQDQASSGSVFTSDQIQYKIRHIYGGGVVDHRSIQKSAVA